VARQLVIELVGEAKKFNKTLDEAGKEASSFGDKMQNTGKKMTAFVSVPVVGFLAASTKAAMDDAAAQAHLATTLSNTVGNSQKLVAQVEGYVEKAMKASTFTDDELRPSFEAFLTTTKDVEKSQKLVNVAMDVAAGKGISLETATLAVAKASEGQFTAVNRLIPGLIDVNDKTMTAEKAVALLSQTFNGQAQAATETTAGKMKNLTRDLGETSEKIGTALLPAITSIATFATDTLIPTLDKVSGGNGAIALLGIAAAGPVLSNVGKLVNGIKALNLTLDATAVKAAAALGAVGLVIHGVRDLKGDLDAVEKRGGSIGDQIKGYVNSLIGGGGDKGIFGKNFLGLATGGPATGGTPYIVGERGPELFVPNSSGTVVPNHRLGGGGTTVHVHVSGSVIAERDLGRTVADAIRNNGLLGVS
jgi:hypothetical protein